MAQWNILLRSLGFTESESKTYLSALETGPSSVQDLARKARISRVTAYAAIEALMGHGLMSTVQKGKKQYYAAESPDRLISVVEERARQMQDKLHEVRDAVEQLKLIHRGEKPIVKLFEGHEALKTIQNDMLSTRPKAVYEIGNRDDIAATYDFEKEIRPWINELKQQKPNYRSLIWSKQQMAASHGILIQLPADIHPFGGDIIVYDNKVALSTFRGKQISVLIESKDIADTMWALFDYVWKCMQRAETSGK